MVMKPHHAYRPDIDGLRAIAVLSVLFYHAFPQLVPGGFVGVDIFFVISGYLISGIIFHDLQNGTFSFANFYLRRIRRIFPALILVLAGCLIIGWYLLLPDEFSQLGTHVTSGAIFVSNLALWHEAGYFDAAAEIKPLLHLWSLGVEEQYYLLWPPLLFLFRGRIQLMLWMILSIAVLSFTVNILLVANYPTATFYSPITRFWELLGGATLAYFSCFRSAYRPGGLQNTQSLFGALLLAAALLLINERCIFPGWWALLPTIGAILVISAGPAAWVNQYVLANRRLVFIGLISYPLYLWHWPLFVYARIVNKGEPPIEVRLAIIVVSLLLAWGTYELVEKKIRYAKTGTVAAYALPALVVSMIAIAIGGVLMLRGYVTPFSASKPQLAEISKASTDSNYGPDKVIKGDTSKAVLFFGDSHIQQYLPRINKICTDHIAPIRTVIFKTQGGCAPVPGIERKGYKCSKFVDEALELALHPDVETVIIGASWVGFINRTDYYRTGEEKGRGEALKMLMPENEWVLQRFEASLNKLIVNGKRVVIVLSSPRGSVFNPKSLINRSWKGVMVKDSFPLVPRSDVITLASPIDSRLREIATRVKATVIDPCDWLCTLDVCPVADKSGNPLYMDDSHIRASVTSAVFGALDNYVYLGDSGLSLFK